MAEAAVAVAPGLHRIVVTVPAVPNPATVAALAAAPNVEVRSRAVPAFGAVCVDRNTLA